MQSDRTEHEETEEAAELDLDSMFVEPPRPATPPKTVSIYRRYEDRHKDADESGVKYLTHHDGNREFNIGFASKWESIHIHLVGSHPLWGHYLWNASRALTTYLDTPSHSSFYTGKNVLELGAGGGLPGIVCALNGARKVVLTDYPDASLIDNLRDNVETNVPDCMKDSVDVLGYVWGSRVDPLLQALSQKSARSTDSTSLSPSRSEEQNFFDLVILSDLIFNHSQHDALLQTCEQVLRPKHSSSLDLSLGTTTVTHEDASISDSQPLTPMTPVVLLSYTHHRPHLVSRDLEFFTKAQQRGWTCREVFRWKYDPMFSTDPGPEEVRAMVYGWVLTR